MTVENSIILKGRCTIVRDLFDKQSKEEIKEEITFNNGGRIATIGTYKYYSLFIKSCDGERI